MNEEASKRLAAMNAAWQRYAKAVEQDLDTIPREALRHDYLSARNKLTALGIAEDMLVYDFASMTFSLPIAEGTTTDDTATILFSTQADQADEDQESDDGPDHERTQLI